MKVKGKQRASYEELWDIYVVYIQNLSEKTVILSHSFIHPPQCCVCAPVEVVCAI